MQIANSLGGGSNLASLNPAPRASQVFSRPEALSLGFPRKSAQGGWYVYDAEKGKYSCEERRGAGERQSDRYIPLVSPFFLPLWSMVWFIVFLP